MDAASTSSVPAYSAAPTLHTLVFNSLHEMIAVIDEAGTIVDVNSSWVKFGVENGQSSEFKWIGRNYFRPLTDFHARGDALAGEAANGIREVVNDRRASFQLEYPCHSRDEQRWFIMRVTRLQGNRRLFAISHHNITQRKWAEEQAEYLSMHDPLTGLANRRYFDLTLEREFRMSMRERSPISLISIDVDHFKDYNDDRGHLAGDDCLARVGKAMLAVTRRPNDLAARVGGDEFAVLLGKTDVVESRRHAETIVKSINDLEIVYGHSQRVTVTAGVACLIPRQLQSREQLLKKADKALYRAKRAGRNRTVLADSVDE